MALDFGERISIIVSSSSPFGLVHPIVPDNCQPRFVAHSAPIGGEAADASSSIHAPAIQYSIGGGWQWGRKSVFRTESRILVRTGGSTTRDNLLRLVGRLATTEALASEDSDATE